MTYTLIDTAPALAEFCRSLQDAAWLAVDTEFVRERTYHARLCLLQVASDTELACIDTLALDDLTPLTGYLFEPATVKVMHAAQQDLEIFQRLWGHLPRPLFDTQLAAALLGQGEQLGYGALVQSQLDVTLEKSQTRTDWSQRPLSEAQLRYAADDVRFLGPLYQRQREALRERGRLDWLWAETALLTAAGDAPAPAEAWRRVKGQQSLRGGQLVVLQVLAAWRETEAEARDLPRQWVVRDEALLTLARRSPRNPEQLQRLGLDPRLLRRDGQTLLALVREARELPAEQWPVPTQRLILSEAEQALLEQAQHLIREVAARHELAPPLLATRRELERWVRGAEIPALADWRATLVGDELQRLRASASVEAGGAAASPDVNR